MEIRKAIISDVRSSFMGVDNAKVYDLVSLVLEANKVFTFGPLRENIPTRAFTMRLNHLGLKSACVGDICTPKIQKGDLLVISSREMKSVICDAYIKTAKDAGAKVALITSDDKNNSGADVTICIKDINNAGQPEGSTYEQVLWLLVDYAEYLLQKHVGGDEEDRVARHANIL